MGLFDGLFSLLGGGGGGNMTGSIAGGVGNSTLTPGAGGAGFNWLPFAQMLGQLGSAVSPRGSWQSRLGGTAANWANSSIYSKAATKGQLPIQDYISALSQGVTPQGMHGISSVKQDKNGEVTLSMTPTQAPQQGTTQPQVQPPF